MNIKGGIRLENIQQLLDMRQQGMTYQEIGEKVGLTRQRVQAIISKEIKYGEIILNDDLYFHVANCFMNQPQGISYIRRVYNALNKANIHTMQDIIDYAGKIDGISNKQWKKLKEYAIQHPDSQK